METQNQNMKHILIVPDKFKGSLTSLQAAQAIRAGLERRYDGAAGGDAVVAAGGVAAGAGHVSGAICAQGAGVGNTGGGICAHGSVSGDAGHDLSAICAHGAEVGHIGGGICSQESVFVDAGHAEDAICAQDTDAGHAEANFCAREGEAGLQFQIVEIADGGDGSLDVVAGRVDSPQRVPVQVHDPLFREIISEILLYRGKGTGSGEEAADKNSFSAVESAAAGAPQNPLQKQAPLCAFIEMAKISGLAMLDKSERNPLNTSTYGLGEAICAAREMGARKITLSIGGSATDDCGAGMLQAIGFEFFNHAGELIPAPICGKDLQNISRIDLPDEPIGCRIEVICDVDNPLLGENGATAVYAPQKGATPQAMEVLEKGKANMAQVAERCLHIFPQMKLLPGAGAAGGVGYAGTAFLGGKLLSGWRFFTEITSLEEKVQWADVVVTGEGSVDSQSLSGKIVGGIMELARKWGKPVEIFCGISSLKEFPQGVRCHSLVSIEPDTQVCMTQAASLLERLAAKTA